MSGGSLLLIKGHLMAKPNGRPRAINANTQKRIADLIRQCSTYKAAAEAVGITYDTFNNWMKRGEAEVQRMAATGETIPLESEADFFNFFNAITRAQADALNLATSVVNLHLVGRAATTETVVEEFVQTRMNQWGKEYQYKEVRTTTKTIAHAPDAHLAIKVLERRDRENWSTKQSDVNVQIDIHTHHATASEEFDILIAGIASRSRPPAIPAEVDDSAEGGTPL